MTFPIIFTKFSWWNLNMLVFKKIDIESNFCSLIDIENKKAN